MMQIENYLDKHGRIKCWPAKTEGKLTVLRHLGNRLVPGRFYTEKEVNRIIEENHAFGDYFLLRREMIDRGVMVRTADGARYWRGRLWAEAAGTETARLTVRDATKQDHADIAELYFACGYLGDWTGSPHDEDSLTAILDSSDLPPDGHREFNHLVVIREKETGSAAGFMQYYTAWPAENRIWIGLMLMHPRCQKLGYGSEVVNALLRESRRQGYDSAGLGVALRNQPGLKFWVKCGFNRITKVMADSEASAGSMGLMGLEMEL